MADLRKEIKKAYKSTPVYKLDELLKEEGRWRRKSTIAANKLAAVRQDINKLAAALAAAAVKP